MIQRAVPVTSCRNYTTYRASDRGGKSSIFTKRL